MPLHGCAAQKGRRFDDRDPGDGSRVVEIEWTGCGRDGAVKLLRVVNGGHDRDFETVEEVWRFFSMFRRDG